MDLPSFRLLLSPSGQQALQAAVALSPIEPDFLFHFQTLSKRFPPELVRPALETAILRLEAAAKFPFASQLYLTRQALEQASSYEISTQRAERFRPYPFLADLGCSIGGDTLALAKVAPTIGIDLDSTRLAMACANLQAVGMPARAHFVQADLAHPLPFERSSAALFFDPARRSAHQRFFSVHQYQPPLEVTRKWLADFPALGVKISPGVNMEEIYDYDAEVEFISLKGELKEAVLWFGPLKAAHRRATILPGPHQLVAFKADDQRGSEIPTTPPKAYLYEPDPSILRAGLVTQLAETLNASQMDHKIAYLTSDKLSPSPFARHWGILDWFPFQLKRLRTYLHQNNVGCVTVKKRGSPLEPDALIRQLRLKGEQERILVLTHLQGEPIVIICDRL